MLTQAFFQHQVLHRQLDHQFLEALVLLLEGLHLSPIGLSEGVPLEPAFAPPP